jgi:hypothetical protein
LAGSLSTLGLCLWCPRANAYAIACCVIRLLIYYRWICSDHVLIGCMCLPVQGAVCSHVRQQGLEGSEALPQWRRQRHDGNVHHPAHRHGQGQAAAGSNRRPGEWRRRSSSTTSKGVVHSQQQQSSRQAGSAYYLVCQGQCSILFWEAHGYARRMRSSLTSF